MLGRLLFAAGVPDQKQSDQHKQDSCYPFHDAPQLVEGSYWNPWGYKFLTVNEHSNNRP